MERILYKRLKNIVAKPVHVPKLYHSNHTPVPSSQRTKLLVVGQTESIKVRWREEEKQRKSTGITKQG